ncbi:hypothetical protein J5N97_030039 [Dioscorea zingiberensis]|uniref:Gag-pol polyprotein n=1 Tax=Dioscorea zingiberensis TaxID=325984 RepID=A0A9D5BWS9_9LILI|nr:hypothetical protein J5N97_030039 [Dioscorea zingiberensis]
MPAEEIPAFIQRVTEESTNRLSQLHIEDDQWDESGVYPPESSGENFSEVVEFAPPTKATNAKGKSISPAIKIKKDKRKELFDQAIEKGLDLPRPKRPCLMHLDSHPNYCAYHRLVGHTIEECQNFQKWVQRQVSTGNLTLTNDYIEEKGERRAIASQDDSEDELNFPAKEDEKVPALLSMYDALMMSTEVRESLIHALQNPEEYQGYFTEINMKEALYAFHAPSVSFTDEDLLLGTTEHNRPLYVTGYCDGMKINRVLIDPGSSVNLMTLNTLRALALEICHLSPEKIVIQGFNQHSQKALGSITLAIKFGKMASDVKFHVIDADAS